MNSSRIYHSATSLADGTVLIAGGFPNITGSNNATNKAEVYTPSSRTFTLTGNMTVPRAYHSATMIYNGDILIAGGEDMDIYSSSFLSAAELYSYPITTAAMLPAYKVTSIIYAPPGNKSQDGYTETATNATTTTIINSFTGAHSLTVSYGFTGSGVSGSSGFGTSHTSANTDAFQETFTNATGVTNQSNSSAPDAINHNNDLFLIWLNPQLTVYGNDSAPVGYNVGIQPLANGTTPLPDIIEVYASNMEANSAGMTTVPYSLLNPIETTTSARKSFNRSILPEHAPWQINADAPLRISHPFWLWIRSCFTTVPQIQSVHIPIPQVRLRQTSLAKRFVEPSQSPPAATAATCPSPSRWGAHNRKV
jgi:hypothetical protein